MNFFDHYSFFARLRPALLTLLPLALGIFAWTGEYAEWQSVLWTLFGIVGGTYFLAILARNYGKQIEPKLWHLWGGTPTTQLLRYSGPSNPVMRERWHKYLEKLLNKPFPTAQEEKDNPIEADRFYEAAVKLVINKTRDTRKFSLVYKENVNYGYCRNLYALRPLGITISLLGLVASGFACYWNIHINSGVIYPWVCAIISGAFFVWWIFMITEVWVKIPAFAYAERLLESIETLSETKTS